MIPTATQRRYAISDRQRQALRQYARLNPSHSQRALALWATREFGRQISQSVVCKTLTSHFDNVDKLSFNRKSRNVSDLLGQFPLLRNIE